MLSPMTTNNTPAPPVIEPSEPSEDEIYLTTNELAARWAKDPGTLANLRSRSEGIPYTKPSGTVLYALSDVLAIELKRKRGFSFQLIEDALESFPGLDSQTRSQVMTHLRRKVRNFEVTDA